MFGFCKRIGATLILLAPVSGGTNAKRNNIAALTVTFAYKRLGYQYLNHKKAPKELIFGAFLCAVHGK